MAKKKQPQKINYPSWFFHWNKPVFRISHPKELVCNNVIASFDEYGEEEINLIELLSHTDCKIPSDIKEQLQNYAIKLIKSDADGDLCDYCCYTTIELYKLKKNKNYEAELKKYNKQYEKHKERLSQWEKWKKVYDNEQKEKDKKRKTMMEAEEIKLLKKLQKKYKNIK